jgi:dTMP kinase|tara:strand:+ start:4473 stop:5093 length:621 start_codon:yes stop_codon:yes gene_type:complete
MSKKLIICFEGIEGSGKSLHLKSVAFFLKKKKIPFIKLREPGGSKNSEKIRKLILNNKATLNKKTDLFLYLAARNENIVNVLNKNYKKKVILIDRFIDSTIAYQHYGMKLDKKIIQINNKYLLKKIKINFTFLLIVSEKNLKLRLSKRKMLNRYDKFNFSFYKRVQNGFINQSKKNKRKYLLINSNNKINKNKKLIILKLRKLLNI